MSNIKMPKWTKINSVIINLFLRIQNVL
jgi:hypothetical protein